MPNNNESNNNESNNISTTLVTLKGPNHVTFTDAKFIKKSIPVLEKKITTILNNTKLNSNYITELKDILKTYNKRDFVQYSELLFSLLERHKKFISKKVPPTRKGGRRRTHRKRRTQKK